MSKKIVIILLLFVCLKSYSQTDTCFWFAAPEVTHTVGSLHSNLPIQLRITAFDKPAQITISQPANPSFITYNISVAANASITQDLTSQINLIESKPADQNINTGLLIKSTSKITVYYEESSEDNPEMFVLKGSNALGTHFFIPAQNIMDNWAFNYPMPSPAPVSSFDIIATEDTTIVTISVTNDIVGHSAGSTFSVTLNKGQVYSAKATSRSAANHLMGSVVKSNKKIAVTIKDDSIGGAGYAGCLDLAGDQIVPIELVGTKYITLPGFLDNPIGKPSDHLFLLATENNTSVTINGLFRKLLNKGETYHDSSMNEVKYIETSLPTYALHLSGFGCEVGHALLPQIECTGSPKVAFTRSNTTDLIMNILVPTGYENKFIFNGNANIIRADSFKNVPFSNNLWMYARIHLDASKLPVNTAAIIENTGIEFHLSIIHGSSITGAIYGYFSDFNKLNVTATSNAVNGAICATDSLKFFTNYNNALATNFNWSFNGTSFSNLPNPTLTNLNTNATGLYSLNATKFSCNKVKVDLPIKVNPLPKPLITTNAPICSGNPLYFQASYVNGSFNWTNSNGFSSTKDTILFNTSTQNLTGKFYLETTALGCKSNDSINIIVYETPKISIYSNNFNPCLGQPFAMQNTVIASTTTNSWYLPNGTFVNNASINIADINYSDTGKYVIKTNTPFCSATDSINVYVKPIPIIQFLVITAVCSNKSQFNILASESSGIIGKFSGFGIDENGLFNPSIIQNSSSTITYTCIKNGCSASQSQNIGIYPSPFISLIEERVINLNGFTNLDAKINGVYDHFYWIDASKTLSDTTLLNAIAKPKVATTYCIVATTNNGCIDTSCVKVIIVNEIKIPNVFSPNGDNINDTWIVEDKTALKHIRITIFDRYGKVVKTAFGTRIEWDGIYNNQLLPVATYYYVMNISENNVTKNVGGWIQLIR